MVLDEEVEVGINSKNIKHFQILGYEVTKPGQRVKVKPEHLMQFSPTIVRVACDHCDKQREIPYKDHFKQGPGNYFCKSCDQILHKTIEELREEFARQNYTLLSSTYINASTDLEYTCNYHPGEVRRIRYTNFIKGKGGCVYCGAAKTAEKLRLDREEVAAMLTEYGYQLVGEYLGAEIPVSYVCLKHPEYVSSNTLAGIRSGSGGCRYCKGSKKSHTEIEEEFRDRGFKLLNSLVFSGADRLYFECEKHKGIEQSITYSNFKSWTGCRYCGIEKRTGPGNYAWKGGISKITSHLRESIEDWKLGSRRASGFKCEICGTSSAMVHHLKSFSSIVSEANYNLGLTASTTRSDYTDEAITQLKTEVIKLHAQYPLGACLCLPHHLEFHKNYGRKDNTADQFSAYYQNKTGMPYEVKYLQNKEKTKCSTS